MRALLLALPFAALLLPACGDPDKPDDTGSAPAADADGDGYDEDNDCDDTDPAVHPGADEVCDGVDNDCDAEVDEEAVDAETFYADADGDGFGDPDTATAACSQPSGYVDDGSDCDDEDPDQSPAADELCDGVDNDCDGLVDDEDTDVTDPSTWYQDADGDGYGVDDLTERACEAPEGYATLGGDCDDSDEAFNPGASETDCTDPNDYNCDGSTGYADEDADGWPACEDCNDSSDSVHPGADEYCDGQDNDCDGTVDEDAVDATSWYEDADRDGRGDPSAAVSACTQPSGTVADSSDCDDGDASVWPGAPELCNGVDDDCDGTVDESDAVDADTWYIDYDSDGYGSSAYSQAACSQPSGWTDNADDCDDADASAYPGATELCDGVDNDCDGDTDEDSAADATTWYIDYDGDSYGSDAYTTQACTQPTGWVDNADDCDDTEAGNYPGADEYCDSVDNDCDGTVDEADALDTTTFYLDVDSDGYGDATTTTMACDAGSGWVADATDCDDGDPSVHPGAAEFCDGADTDCDGIADEDDALDALTWYADGDGDGYGDAASTSIACSQPSGAVADATDCDDGDAAIYPGADEYCDGIDTDCDGTLDDSDALDFDTWYADADGDGYGDSASGTSACSQPSGTIADSSDCDDGDAAVFPGADEYCDGVDNDCDGTVDEDDALDVATWYLDADGDGYGDETDTVDACTAPSGYVAAAGDCDDDDASVTECTFREFDGTYASSWETLDSALDDLYSVQTYHTADMAYIYNMYDTTGQRYDPTTDTWTELSATAPYSAPWTSMAPVDGDLWMIRNSAVYSYAPDTDTWTTVTSISGSDDLNMTESDEYGVVYGHTTSGQIVSYDTTTGTVGYFTTGRGAQHETRMGYDPDERAIFFGSYSSSALYRWGIDDGTVSTMTSIPESQLNDIFCSDRSGHIYAAGGGSGTSMYQYDVASNSWSSIPPLPSDHGNNGSCTVSEDGWLYVGSGSNMRWYRLELY